MPHLFLSSTFSFPHPRYWNAKRLKIFDPQLNFKSLETFPDFLHVLGFPAFPDFLEKKGKYGKVFDMNVPNMSVFWTFRSRGSPQYKPFGHRVAFPSLTT